MKFFECPKLTSEFGSHIFPDELDKILDYIEAYPNRSEVTNILTCLKDPGCTTQTLRPHIEDLIHILEIDIDRHSGGSFSHFMHLVSCILKEGGRDAFISKNNPHG
ncbi:MAG: hypothetical protein ACOYKA_04465 [Legionellaceae bacterium]